MARTRVFTGTVGQIISSTLTEAQFQAINGTSWVLMDGRSVVGSAYATVTGFTAVPDARGMVLRGRNNGRADGKENPDGEIGLGAYQADEIRAHSHTVETSQTQEGVGRFTGGSSLNEPSILSTNNFGGNETRMKNITVNHFIKIND
jgi:hypothetical protein